MTQALQASPLPHLLPPHCVDGATKGHHLKPPESSPAVFTSPWC